MADDDAPARTYPHGVPCWVDTEQPDPVAAARFYTGLFGWAFHEVLPDEAPGSYLVATLGGRDVAAVGSGERPGWTTYVACTDANAAAVAVIEAGGRVLDPPADAGPGGRAATCADPDGVQFRLWQARRRPGAQSVNAPDTWNFSHLHTGDPERALLFYGSVFGWQHDAEQGAGMLHVPGYGAHLASTVDPDIHERQAFAPPGFEDVVAGLVTGKGEPRFEVRFTVADRDASAATAERLGGVVLSSLDTDWTRDADILDPQGARLTLSQFTPPPTSGGA